MNYSDNFLNAINILSFVLALENLQENRQQSEHNDVQNANDKQAEYLLQQINKRFDEQNQILEEQNKLLKQLLERLN